MERKINIGSDAPTKSTDTDKHTGLHSLKRPLGFSPRQLLLYGFVFTLAGIYFLWQALATGPIVTTLEAERMTLPVGGTVVNDALASGGQAAKLTKFGNATAPVNFVKPVSSITVKSRAVKCQYNWPKINVAVDGVVAMNVAVKSSSWKSYNLTKNFSSGTHTISIGFTNTTRVVACMPTLYLDVSIYYGQEVTPTPLPTVSLSASPLSVVTGGSSTLTWSSANATSCTASGSWSGSKPLNGSASTGALNQTSTYSLTCLGDGGSATGNVTAQVLATSPVVNSLGLLRINPNEPLPSDLSKYSMLLLDSSRYQQVAGLKSKYPKLKVLAYKDLTLVCNYALDQSGNTGVTWPQAQTNTIWYLLNSSGQYQSSIPYPKCYFMDPNSLSYQQTWASNVISWLKQVPWDGVFMDDTNADNGYHLNYKYNLLTKYPTRDLYRAAVRNLLAYTSSQVKAAGFIAIPNIGAAWDQQDVWADWSSLASGAMREHYLRWGDGAVLKGADWKIHTDNQRAVEAVGRQFIALTYGSITDSASQRYVRASFLLFWEPSNNSLGMWSIDDGAAFDADLGKPLGSATQNGSVWTRQFERGKVTVDTSLGTASIQ